MPSNFNNGKAYYYIDNKLSSFKYKDDITASSSPIMKTLAQIQNLKQNNYASVFWNDQPNEESASSIYAHSKGIIGVDSTQGFILNHSTPKFPIFKNDKIELTIDDSQLIYGQHFFCMSATTSTINKYAQGLQLDRVFTFKQSSVPDSLNSQLKSLKELLENNQKEGTYTENSFQTLGSQQIIQFAKSGKWVESFYSKVVAPSYKLNFIFETWGRPLSSPNCDQYSVVSNLQVRFSDQVQYSYTKDHSKYGISTTSDIVCFGDVNRQDSQYSRGGGTNCFSNKIIYDFLKKALVEQQQC